MVFGVAVFVSLMKVECRYWIVDVARLFPPFPPTKEERHLILCNFLHPTVVKANSIPLSADAFSGFNKKSSKADNDEVRACCDRFLTQGISNCAVYWDRNPHASFSEIRSLFGLNARFLGRVFVCLEGESVRRAVLMEMVQRACKADARKLRTKAELMQWVRRRELFAMRLLSNDVFFQNVQSVSLVDLVGKKFGLETEGLQQEGLSSLFDQDRFDRELGRVWRRKDEKRRRLDEGEDEEMEVIPVVARMKALSVLEDAKTVLLRGETIGKRSLSKSASEFKSGFLQVRRSLRFWSFLAEVMVVNRSWKERILTRNWLKTRCKTP